MWIKPIAASAILFGLMAATAVPADADPLTVVELFTSQGCSSCPPANANLIALSQQPGVLALSFSVTYWDRLGWKDTFAKQDFTDRQVVYEAPLNQFGPYTPQMVVNGRTTAVGNRIGEMEALIAGAPPLDGPAITIRDGLLGIAQGIGPEQGADIWRVTYDPQTIDVAVGRGENTGRTLAHTHVMHDLKNLGTWRGGEIKLPLAPTPTGLRTAILVQKKNGGPILSAATN